MRISELGVEDLKPVAGIPLLLEVNTQGVKLLDWAQENQEDVRRLVTENGALLIRGLRFLGSQQFGSLLSTLFGSELLEYRYRSTPRTKLRDNVYTATEYPAHETIPQHNENAYSRKWPTRIGFLCLLPSKTGGETPIADSRLIYDRISPHIRAEFEEKGVMYVRNYSDLDLPWTEVFQTEDRQEVERYCDENHIEYEWIGEARLRTRQVNAASLVHPITGKRVWFNQAHLFHVSSLHPDIQDTLIESLGKEYLPRNCYFGDGSEIDERSLQEVRRVYEETLIKFSWQQNDLLLLDNLRFSHGREPFTGERRVLTGMA
ncbi:MAG: TauD/TfdA family dioxygenase [Xanthomonadaceae bacterium]|nr:TauD/TfdA family dioxygenase [Xanthomonadaceae bacterium]